MKFLNYYLCSFTSTKLFIYLLYNKSAKKRTGNILRKVSRLISGHLYINTQANELCISPTVIGVCLQNTLQRNRLKQCELKCSQHLFTVLFIKIRILFPSSKCATEHQLALNVQTHTKMHILNYLNLLLLLGDCVELVTWF